MCVLMMCEGECVWKFCVCVVFDDDVCECVSDVMM